jgi:hypothetical protein
VFALIVYEISIGYYLTHIASHRCGYIERQYLLIKVSAMATIFRGQVRTSVTSIADLLDGLTALVVLQLGMMPGLARLGLFLSLWCRCCF